LPEYQNFFAASFLSFLRNYFDGPIKLFSDLYLTKFLYFRKTVLSVYFSSALSIAIYDYRRYILHTHTHKFHENIFTLTTCNRIETYVAMLI